MDKQQKRILTYSISGAIILLVALFAIFQPTTITKKGTLKEQTFEIWGDGVDLSNSLFPPSDYAAVQAEINENVEEIEARETITGEQVVVLAREAYKVRDYNKAEQLFELATTTDFSDKYYLIDYGNMYLEMGQWENARRIFEPMKITYPVHEAYIGLAQAYKNIEGTPDYVVDAIYEESIQRNFNQFEVVQEYITWLEATDREEKTLPYYQILNEKVPQEALERKIQELKQKYPDAPLEL